MSDPQSTEGGPAGSPEADGAPRRPRNFIEQRIDADLASGRVRRVHTRFPPEPNGYLHIGHALSIWLNFGIAERYGGLCNLRFDDTNPAKEEQEYVEAILEDVRWLGYDWGERLYHASDYFEQLYEWALVLIRKGRAYVCDLPLEEVRRGRGTLTEPGVNSPFRDRSPEENEDLFRRMRAGEFPDGSRTLRAKIDMAAPNLLMRDPVMYRILRRPHQRTGEAWCIYPTYDWAHGQSDAIEGITHSICTLEFENHRPLYEWFLEQLELPDPPVQIEFARLNLTHAITSKRKTLAMIESGVVDGWDDPRLFTLRALRRRGYTPEAIREFCARVGVARANKRNELALLENTLREDLNRRAPRRMGVLRPLELVIETYPEDAEETVEAVNNPEDPSAGTRPVPFSGRLFVERDDFREDPPRKWHRLAPGQEVRLRYAYYVTVTRVEKDPETGEVVRLVASHDPQSRGGSTPDGRKVRGTIHWVSARHARRVEARLFEPLFLHEDPEDVPEGEDWRASLNPNSVETAEALVEPSVAELGPGERFQFERLGYFCVDTVDSRPGAPVLLRSVTLRDSWAKLERKLSAGG